MFGLGPAELIIIFLIVLVLFGAGKLPQIGDGLGSAIRNFRRSVSADEKPPLSQTAAKITDHTSPESNSTGLDRH